ncbi:hypothetical protein M569_15129, partial [Genlisea aurea]
REITAASGSSSGHAVVDSLMSGCGNLSGFVNSDLCFVGKSDKMCRWGRLSMKIGCNRWSFVHTVSNFPLGLFNARMLSLSSNSDTVSSSDADASLGLEQISRPAVSVQLKEPSPSSTLKLVSGSCCVPNRSEVKTGGEGAFFICHDEQSIGVAD